MDLVALTLAILTALGLDAGPRFEQSVALVQAVVREADAAGVPADVALSYCARASRMGLDDVPACGCGRHRYDVNRQARCAARRIAAGRRRCGTLARGVQRALSGHCGSAIGARRTVYLIRERIGGVPLTSWAAR